MKHATRIASKAVLAVLITVGVNTNASAATVPIVGDVTAVELISYDLLTGFGLTVGPLGLATVDSSGSNPVVLFPITGGTLDTVTGAALIEHNGSGLFITDGVDTVSLENFLIDTEAGKLYGDVGVNGSAVGNIELFTISGSLTLLLSADAADALNDIFDLKLKEREKIGRATIKLTTVPIPAALPLLLSGLAGIGLFARRRKAG